MSVGIDPTTAIVVAIVAIGVLYGGRSIERGIMIQTKNVVDRGTTIEATLQIKSGAFGKLQWRLDSSRTHRITGIIDVGYIIASIISSILMILGIWAAFR